MAEEEVKPAAEGAVEAPPAEEEEEEYFPESSLGGGGGAGAPTWIVTFADLATLVLTFFVLLLSFANMDIIKFRQLMGSMKEAFGVTKAVKGEHQLMREEKTVAEKLGIVKTGEDKEREEKDMLSDLVYDSATKSGILNNVRITYGKDGITVRVDNEIMFDSGKADLKEQVFPFLEGLAGIMRSFHYNLLVEGHTDDVPIKTKIFPSNWELSTVRATTVVRKLIEAGTKPDRLAAVGYADRKPLRENSSPENRAANRRVEFKFVRIKI